ncbi:NADP-dependent oxidoreductase [Candidatus Microgenomates bacterium]|nr:NADP-dependent oxidoreductase [Candidatus Microgenomates bacterium]
MKAVQYSQYGGVEVLEIRDNLPNPQLKKGQILVAVTAASLNPVDWKIRAGMLKNMVQLQFPVTIGGDFAGSVVGLDEGVDKFKVGDEVYGSALILAGGSGSLAEFASVGIANTALKPKTLDFAASAALPLVGTSTIQALEETIKLQSGQKILIHGGAGGIGHLAIQLAKVLGAYVATTASGDDLDFVKSLGADMVIDYKTQKFSEVIHDYDAVFDLVGGEVANQSFAILKKGGMLVSMLGQPDQNLARKHQVTAMGQVTGISVNRLNRLTELVDSGKIKPHIDKVFPLDQAKEALTYQEQNNPRGKVVIKIK